MRKYALDSVVCRSRLAVGDPDEKARCPQSRRHPVADRRLIGLAAALKADQDQPCRSAGPEQLEAFASNAAAGHEVGDLRD